MHSRLSGAMNPLSPDPSVRSVPATYSMEASILAPRTNPDTKTPRRVGVTAMNYSHPRSDT